MLEDVHDARGMHRRLKARFSLTETFTITPGPQSTTDADAQPTNSLTDTNSSTSSARKSLASLRALAGQHTPVARRVLVSLHSSNIF